MTGTSWDITNLALSSGAGAAFLAGIWLGIKYFRSGALAMPAPCPAADTLKAVNDQNIRSTEALQGLATSVDRLAQGLYEQSKAIRDSNEEQTRAIIRLAEMATRRPE